MGEHSLVDIPLTFFSVHCSLLVCSLFLSHSLSYLLRLSGARTNRFRITVQPCPVSEQHPGSPYDSPYAQHS